MSNLYGGMPGNSFNIKGSFPTVADMITNFSLGPNYTDVWYGDYCIIDTLNKNNMDNGKLYRRGYNYTNDVGGAEYIGQIVGPSSGTPYMQIDSLDKAHGYSTEQLREGEFRRYPSGRDEDGNYIVVEDGAQIADFSFNSTNALVPGKTETGEFNDDIIYTWVNIARNDSDAGSWFYVGLQIPYLVNDFVSETVSAYDSSGVIKSNPISISRTDDGTHPYYEEWTLHVSKGIKGDTLRNMRVIVPTASDVIYSINAFTVHQDGTVSVDSPGYDGQADDIANGRAIVVYDFYVYDQYKNPAPYTIYFGDYNQANGITIDDDGTITFAQTHDDDTIFSRKIKWIDDVSLTTGDGAEGGHFTVLYNNGDPAYETDISWIKNIEIQENGTVVYTFAGAGDEDTDSTTGIKQVPRLLKWISEISLNTTNGVFKVGYNNNSSAFTATLDWIKSIVLDNDGTLHFIHTADERDEAYANKLKWIDSVAVSPSGVFRVNYNYGEPYEAILDYVDNIVIDEATGNITVHKINSGDSVLTTKLKMVNSASVSSDGVVTFTTNTGDTFNLKDSSNNDYHWRSIDNVTLATSLNADHHINIKYNDATETTPIGDSLNWIQDMVVDANNYHLYVLFTDPTKRPVASDLVNGVDAYGNKWRTGISGSGSVDYSSLYWRDLGTIKDQSGVLIGVNLTDDNLLPSEQAMTDSKQAVITALTRLYPNGYAGGKIATYAGTLTENKEFYAYDYNSNVWYYLGTISGDGRASAILVSGNYIDPETLDGMSTNALAFKVIATKGYDGADLQVNDIPQFWAYNYNSWV